jgi:ketosteroid isomerase-like protein
MAEPVDVIRALYTAVADGDQTAIAHRLAPGVRWQGRERRVRWRRRRSFCAGAHEATQSMLVLGRKLPALEPRTFQSAGDRVMVGLWADTMEGRPTRWWTVLTVHDGQVVAIEDHTRQRDAARMLARSSATET